MESDELEFAILVKTTQEVFPQENFARAVNVIDAIHFNPKASAAGKSCVLVSRKAGSEDAWTEWKE